jgi:hypothetical protein
MVDRVFLADQRSRIHMIIPKDQITQTEYLHYPKEDPVASSQRDYAVKNTRDGKRGSIKPESKHERRIPTNLAVVICNKRT